VQVAVSDIPGTNTCTASFPARAGVNKVEWTMRWTPPAGGAPQPGRAGGGGGGGRGGRGGGAPAACLIAANQAPAPGGRGGGGGGRGGGGGGLVPPGDYRVTLTAGGQTYTQSIRVRRDPMLDEIR
jgi:hypothetical protein